MRTCPVKGYNVSSPRTSSDNYGGHYERSFNRRQWRANGSSYPRWWPFPLVIACNSTSCKSYDLENSISGCRSWFWH